MKIRVKHGNSRKFIKIRVKHEYLFSCNNGKRVLPTPKGPKMGRNDSKRAKIDPKSSKSGKFVFKMKIRENS